GGLGRARFGGGKQLSRPSHQAVAGEPDPFLAGERAGAEPVEQAEIGAQSGLRIDLEVDRVGNDVPTRRGEGAHGTRHMVGRGDENPVLSWHGPEQLIGIDRVLMGAARPLLKKYAVWGNSFRDGKRLRGASF